VWSYDDGGYDWSQVDVWLRKSDGRLFVYVDSGCSCNGPYEDVTGWDNLVPLTSIKQFASLVDQTFYSDRPSSFEMMQVAAKIQTLLLLSS
jgi:hypothetical protein